MSRHLLIRGDDGDQLVPESRLPLEAKLHEALAANPQLIPTSDLGLGTTIVVGSESHLGAGFADLVMVDETGQLCLLETKKPDNPDTRKVAAQLLDYAANLWRLTLDEFADKVVRPHLAHKHRDTSGSLPELLAASFQAETNLDVDHQLLGRTIETALHEGRFQLVVAAPEIPARVERVLEYLNTQGLLCYGLEIGYFHGHVDCFVPRVTVKPPAPSRQRGNPPPLTPNAFLDSLDQDISAIVARTLDAAEQAGARIEWKSYGATISRRCRQGGSTPTGSACAAFSAPLQLRVARSLPARRVERSSGAW